MIDHSWVSWFRELVQRIAEGGPDYLAEKANAVSWGKDNPPILGYGAENIDPFSFIYTLASYMGDKRFMQRLRSVRDVFSIHAEFPGQRPYIPTPNPTNTLFHDAGIGNPDLLWQLFQASAVDASDLNGTLFDGALEIKQVAMSKLTQALFIINPLTFFPADNSFKRAIELGMVLNVSNDPKNYSEYEACIQALKASFPSCTLFEINTFLYQQVSDKPLITDKTNYFQVSTNVYNDQSNYWPDFKVENAVWTGGEGSEKTSYPLSDPKRGDIVLVRFGVANGHGVGVVEANGYSDGWSEEESISVYWINKIEAPLEGQTTRHGFGHARKGSGSYRAFQQAEGYSDTLHLIERLARQGTGELADSPRTEAESAASLPLNLILCGPPGTGKTFDTVAKAVEAVAVDGGLPGDRHELKKCFNKLREAGRVDFVTFHQNYAYEDFIEGIRPVLDKSGGKLRYELRDGIFKRIAKAAAEDDSDKPYVLIIDEINRGNIAKVFGELITLIEPSKRAGGDDEAEATLPYSQEPFSVPSNLHLIGTMNTADRGIALLDVALRRRFYFEPRMPKANHIEIREDIEGVNGRELLRAINERIVENLDREHQIGHTYLMKVATLEVLARVFRNQIVPLLQEYFYDDWEKMHGVLNRNAFITRREGAERPVFDVLPADDDRWQDAESYRAIYGSTSGDAESG